MPPQEFPKDNNSAVAAKLKRLFAAASEEPDTRIDEALASHFPLITRVDRNRNSLRERIITCVDSDDGDDDRPIYTGNWLTRRAPTLDELDRM